jgi:hypothetical protein
VKAVNQLANDVVIWFFSDEITVWAQGATQLQKAAIPVDCNQPWSTVTNPTGDSLSNDSACELLLL